MLNFQENLKKYQCPKEKQNGHQKKKKKQITVTECCQLAMVCYVICIYSEIKIIKILGNNSYSSWDSCFCMQQTLSTNKENRSEIEEYGEMGDIPWHEKDIEKRFPTTW